MKNFPKADDWMWDYCIYLGSDSEFDYGVYVYPDGRVSHAIVYGDEPGDYISGEIEYGWTSLPARENHRRWVTFQLGGL